MIFVRWKLSHLLYKDDLLLFSGDQREIQSRDFNYITNEMIRGNSCSAIEMFHRERNQLFVIQLQSDD